MPLLIQTSPDPYYTQRVRLDGRDYLFRFAWNQREERWSLSLFTDRDEPILLQLKLFANWPLFVHYRYEERLPAGDIMAVDGTGDGSPPLLDELGEGRRCQLLYFTPDELAEIAAS